MHYHIPTHLGFLLSLQEEKESLKFQRSFSKSSMTHYSTASHGLSPLQSVLHFLLIILAEQQFNY